MQGNYEFSTFHDFTRYIDAEVKQGSDILLFRGQVNRGELMPGIARQELSVSYEVAEREMVEEIKRRTRNLPHTHQFDEWDWLIYAQHFGMKTRLLDWSINPLVSLWFACNNEWQQNNPSYLYVLQANKNMLVNTKDDKDPFNIDRLRILKPALNNERIVAQAGWFTVHPVNKQEGKFEELSTGNYTAKQIYEVHIPPHVKPALLRQLDLYGVNYNSMFPGIEGICRYMNFLYASPFNTNSQGNAGGNNKAITAT